MKNLTTRDLTTLSLLIALAVIFKKFLSVELEIMRFSTYFIVIAVTGAIYGPITAGIVGVIVDLLYSLLFPSGFGIFFGFTLSAFVEGLIYGFFLYNKKKSVLNVSLAVVTFTIIVSYFLNVLWVTLMNEAPSTEFFMATLQAKVIKSIFVVPTQIVILTLIMRLFDTTFAGVISGLNQKKANN